ncbi:Rha family transcriptional regulator [Rossellomorea sp. BNER]|uniref:Rha family transcriptional regulator n=1 Tax=Rossellomorea sp. BNER TaxID=2962031 RepID=UPI003AF28334|nr:Rha family transcriptional regulator [Rossellomorea sp. BNER]
MSNLVFIKNGQVVTDSLKLAKKFDKRHGDVIRAIENLECSEDFNERNFALVNYVDKKGETRPKYNMTYDGFAFIAMGFTGKKAAKFKEEYITEFNEMKKQLKEIDMMMNVKGELSEEEYAKVKFSTSQRVKRTFLESQDIFKDYNRFVMYSQKTMDTKKRVRRLNQIIETLKAREDELYLSKRKGYRAERENIIELTEEILRDINEINNRSYGQKLGWVNRKIG